jgi:NAD(P)-dependent dehydrogenase (short-subunit alcohol dehydrogenase family)
MDKVETSLLAEMAAKGGGTNRIFAAQADVSQECEVERFFAQVRTVFGRLDIVVHCAGISESQLLVNTTSNQWDTVIGTNLTGSFLIARQAVRTFLEQDSGGRIIFLGSVVQNGAASNASYATSKGGVQGLAQTIAEEYGGYGIYSHLIAAGYIQTQLTAQLPRSMEQLVKLSCPQKRMGLREEVANMVLFLAAHPMVSLNGQTIYVAGGLTEAPPYTRLPHPE